MGQRSIPKRDLYSAVTQRILAELETGGSRLSERIAEPLGSGVKLVGALGVCGPRAPHHRRLPMAPR